jgi:hypothetical protein
MQSWRLIGTRTVECREGATAAAAPEGGNAAPAAPVGVDPVAFTDADLGPFSGFATEDDGDRERVSGVDAVMAVRRDDESGCRGAIHQQQFTGAAFVQKTPSTSLPDHFV